MSNIISVWGSPGSGKSTVAALLARQLAQEKKNTVLIDMCMTAPQMSIWLPYEEGITFNSSINSLIRDDKLTLEKVSQRVIAVTDHLGVMGFVRGESPVYSKQNQRTDKFMELIGFISGMAEQIVIDLNPSILDDVYTVKALEISDTVLRVITPDIKGVVFEQSNLPMLNDVRFHSDRHLRVGGCCKSFHNVSLIENIIGSFDLLLPYCEDIELLAVLGKLLSDFSSKEYCLYQKLLRKAVIGA